MPAEPEILPQEAGMQVERAHELVGLSELARKPGPGRALEQRRLGPVAVVEPGRKHRRIVRSDS